MNPEETRREQPHARKPYSVHLPGFILEEEIGFGDVIKQVTSAIGIRPCNRCAQRAATLNRWVVLVGRRER